MEESSFICADADHIQPPTSIRVFRMVGHAASTASNGSYLPCSAFSNHSRGMGALGRAKPSATHGLGETDILENQKPRLCASLFLVIYRTKMLIRCSVT